MMETLTIDLEERSYPIYIGASLMSHPELIKPHIHGKSILAVSNTTVSPLYMDQLISGLDSYKSATSILDDGEQYKNLETLNQIYSQLLEGRYDRNTTLIALGGGVVGDITGYAAASYQRGINFIQVPTTLLAMVDSSVGGKTGVNHRLGKNMIGAFHQPQCVIIDTDSLDTLDDRQLRAGLAEVIKYGLIIDSKFLLWLEENIEKLLNRDKPALTYAIKRSCEIKARVVSEDEKEKGIRAILNLGHTFGHAIETGVGYGQWLHGEAIASGMVMAALMSKKMGMISSDDVERVMALFKRTGLPIKPPESMSDNDFLNLMSVDKKVLDGQLRLVLLESLGQAVVTADFSQETLESTLTDCR